jgi:hypothetical protein
VIWGPTNRPSDRQTDQLTDQRTDEVSYRGAMLAPKNKNPPNTHKTPEKKRADTPRPPDPQAPDLHSSVASFSHYTSHYEGGQPKPKLTNEKPFSKPRPNI